MSALRSARAGRARAAMTLIEILIAMGILALGMMGILTLFPLAIRSIGKAVDRTIGSAVAKNVVASLDNYAIELSDTATYQGVLDLNQDGAANPSDDAYLDGSSQLWGLSAAITAYNAGLIADGQPALGHGVPRRTFRIPEDLSGPTALYDSDGDGNPDSVPVPWHTDFRWTATFVPTPVDDDSDGYGDNDPVGGGFGGADDVNISDQNPFTVQVAVWRNFRLTSNIGSPTGTFHYDSPYVDISGAAPAFWSRVRAGDYLRHEAHGIWYQILELDEAGGRAVLAENFTHPVLTPSYTSQGPDPIELASQWRLVALHEAIVGRQ